MTYSKKQEITENNEKHSNWPAGRCSGPLLDIFGSTEPWAHALSPRFQRKKLNLNILGPKIEICAQNSAFLRKKIPHIIQKISEPKQPTDDWTTWPRSPWVVLTTYQKRNILWANVAHLREPTKTRGKWQERLWQHCPRLLRCHQYHCFFLGSLAYL